MALSVLLLVVLLILLTINFYWINKNQWKKVFCLFFSLLLLIPVEAHGIISGAPYSTPGLLNLSLAGYDIILVIISTIFTRKKIKNITKHKFISVILCIAVIIGMRFLVDGISAPSNKMFDNYCLPIAGALIMANFLELEDLRQVLKYVYFLIFINGIFACIEYFVGQSLFFHNYYSNNAPWYNNIYNSTTYGVAFRSTALLGHPLINGIYYLIGIAYLYNKTKMKFNIPSLIQMGILAFAVFSTNSRMAIVAFLIYTLIMLLKEKRIGKILLLTLFIIFLVVKVDFVEVYMNIFSRDSNGSSFLVRVAALTNFSKVPFLTLIVGTGFNNTEQVLNLLGFTSNLEISFLIILLENGIIAFIVWIKALSALYKKNMISEYKGIKLKSMINGMICCFLALAATSNSIGDPGTLNYTLFSIMAFSFISSKKEIKDEGEI